MLWNSSTFCPNGYFDKERKIKIVKNKIASLCIIKTSQKLEVFRTKSKVCLVCGKIQKKIYCIFVDRLWMQAEIAPKPFLIISFHLNTI